MPTEGFLMSTELNRAEDEQYFRLKNLFKSKQAEKASKLFRKPAVHKHWHKLLLHSLLKSNCVLAEFIITEVAGIYVHSQKMTKEDFVIFVSGIWANENFQFSLLAKELIAHEKFTPPNNLTSHDSLAFVQAKRRKMFDVLQQALGDAVGLGLIDLKTNHTQRFVELLILQNDCILLTKAATQATK